MKTLYTFWGGEYDNQTMTREEIEKISTGEMCNGHPKVRGYCSPRHGDIVHKVNGTMKGDIFCTEEERQSEAFLIVTYLDPRVSDDIFD